MVCEAQWLLPVNKRIAWRLHCGKSFFAADSAVSQKPCEKVNADIVSDETIVGGNGLSRLLPATPSSFNDIKMC